MLRIDISVKAEADLDRIAEYTKITWGWHQAEMYLAKLEEGFMRIAGNPHLGRRCDSIRDGLYRLEVEKHVAFYIPSQAAVLIVRVLHQQMLPVESRFGDSK
jgi:toxin ParE1/3/4